MYFDILDLFLLNYQYKSADMIKRKKQIGNYKLLYHGSIRLFFLNSQVDFSEHR